MQDRYVGDVGDFGKLGMFRRIADSGLRVGINWYRTYKPEEHDNNDGKHISYLNNKLFQGCDDELLDRLRQMVEGNRSIAALETAELIPDAQYYSEILRPGNDRSFSRDIWYNNSLEALSHSDIIFCDPDNGLLVKSVSLSSAKSDKYITEDELVSYYLLGKSVVFYNHRCREKEEVYLRRFKPLQLRGELVSAKWRGLKFTRGSVRDFIFILQPVHFEIVNDVIKKMMQSSWNRHFSTIDI
ncbi:MAG: hypothetical protein WBJ17_00805 [Natronincolaceae bacterium]|jgi:hypothetical protein|nr:hypothetical protein [Bacillota bacterium]NLK91364.1 hypothetical protein [Clostridiales bacterium]